jgi:hypothetical protein
MRTPAQLAVVAVSLLVLGCCDAAAISIVTSPCLAEAEPMYRVAHILLIALMVLGLMRLCRRRADAKDDSTNSDTVTLSDDPSSDTSSDPSDEQ